MSVAARLRAVASRQRASASHARAPPSRRRRVLRDGGGGARQRSQVHKARPPAVQPQPVAIAADRAASVFAASTRRRHRRIASAHRSSRGGDDGGDGGLSGLGAAATDAGSGGSGGNCARTVSVVAAPTIGRRLERRRVLKGGQHLAEQRDGRCGAAAAAALQLDEGVDQRAGRSGVVVHMSSAGAAGDWPASVLPAREIAAHQRGGSRFPAAPPRLPAHHPRRLWGCPQKRDEGERHGLCRAELRGAPRAAVALAADLAQRLASNFHSANYFRRSP